MYERGNEAILAWLSEGILELHRKISEKKKERSNSISHSPYSKLDASLFAGILVMLLGRKVDISGWRENQASKAH